MLRTAALYALPAVLIATGWLRLEDGGRGGETVGFVLLALVPALVRPWWGRVLAAAVVSLVAVRLAFGLSILDARPRDEEREFFGPLASAFWTGSIQYFERAQPFPPQEFPLMHGVLLAAVFGFCLALALAIAARKPLLATFVLAAGAVWPATLVSGADLLRGALLLASALVLLAAAGPRPPRITKPAVAAGLALLVAGVAAGAQPAVAKTRFLEWTAWDFYDAPPEPVGVRFVWDANYGGITFPEEKTTVLTVEGPRRPLYWRASTLDTFADDRWTASVEPFLVSDRRVDLSADALLPQRGRSARSHVRATVRVEALRDDHLVAPGTPVLLDPGNLDSVEYRTGGVAVVPDGLEHGDLYTVWAYAPRPTPEELTGVGSEPVELYRKNAQEPYLELAPGMAAPPFGDGAREGALERLFAQPRGRHLVPYRELYREARRVVGDPESPYAAAIALEAWFRTGGGFTYDEQPPPRAAGRAPLLHFALDSKRGYCQHYAGAMALMLRYLGIPARVAAGFTSGEYDENRKRWSISNHDAHAWVEVWFQGWGWIPFDPTPARGELPGTHSSSAPEFPSSAVAQYLRGAGAAAGAGFVAVDGIRSDRRISADGSSFRGDTPGDLGTGGTAAAIAERGDSLVRLLLLLALALGATVAAAKTLVRRGRYATRDPRRLAAACRSELVDILLDQRVRVSRSATLQELADLAQSHLLVDADRFAHLAAEARFAPPDDARRAAGEARRELGAIRRKLRQRLSAARRVRGLLSVRSLGFDAS